MTEKKQTMFGVLDDFSALFELVEEATDENREEAQEMLKQFMEELVANFESKADGYAWVIADALAKAKAQKDEAKRFQAMAKSNENKASKLKSMLQYAMERLKLDKLDTGKHKFGIQKNGGKRSLTLLVSEEELAKELPEKYVHVVKKVKIDKDLLRCDIEAMEQDQEINPEEDAVEIIPHVILEPQGKSLRIR
jgi:hypothetical protein